MKKIITGVVVVIILICVYLVIKNISIFTSTRSIINTQTSTPVSISSWETYNNSINGLSFMYPTELSLEPNTSSGYPEVIEFKPANIKLGSFFTLTIYNLAVAKSHGVPIVDLKSVPQTNYNSTTPTTISNFVVNNLSIQLTKQGTERATIVLIDGANAYRLDWSCWSQQPCFNDDVLSKIINSISFVK